METTFRWPRLVGGHVALDFVNTDVVSEHDRPSDVLRSADEFTAWCAYADVPGVTTVGVCGANGDELLGETRSLRTAIRNVVESIAAGRAADDQALSTVQSAYTTAISHAIPTISDDRLSWHWTTPTPKTLVWALTTSAVALLRDGPTDRIKVCPTCGFVFLDTTKNRSRRWCSMDDCGKQEKIRRYLAKRAETRRPSDR